MANSWIGETGRKYDRLSNGVVCGHGTAMNLWTKGLIEYKTVSVDTFDGNEIYLVREQKIMIKIIIIFISYIAPFLLINQ